MNIKEMRQAVEILGKEWNLGKKNQKLKEIHVLGYI